MGYGERGMTEDRKGKGLPGLGNVLKLSQECFQILPQLTRKVVRYAEARQIDTQVDR